jgi:hypothetical protein
MKDVFLLAFAIFSVILAAWAPTPVAAQIVSYSRVFARHTASARTVIMDAAGKNVFSGADDGTIRWYAAEDATLLRTFRVSGRVLVMKLFGKSRLAHS